MAKSLAGEYVQGSAFDGDLSSLFAASDGIISLGYNPASTSPTYLSMSADGALSTEIELFGECQYHCFQK